MKIALIGDIHGNLPALESVLNAIRESGCGHILDTGDLIGYGPFPNEVIACVRRHYVQTIKGNYDRQVCLFGQRPQKEAKLKRKAPFKYLTIEWTHRTLSQSNLQYLASLPEQREFIFEGMRVLLVHGSIDSRKEGLRSDTPDERLHEFAEHTTADVIISGHSHDPFVRKVNKTWFINTGSVGRPGDGDYRAAYVVAQIRNRKLNAKVHRVDYDLSRLLIALRQNGFPEEFAGMFKNAVHLSEVVSGEPDTLRTAAEVVSTP